jgi:hypothetical protein
MGRHERGRAPFAQQLFEDSLNSIHGAMPAQLCKIPVTILAATPPTLVRADFTSSMPSGINLDSFSPCTPRKKKFPLSTDEQWTIWR